MAGLRGLFVQRDASNNGTTPKGARLALGGLLAPSTTDPLSVRTGVLVDGMQAVVSGTGSMAYQVRGFVGVTKFTDANGPVIAASDAPVSVPTTPSPGSNSRIDRVWMIQRLVTGDGGSGTVNVFEFGVTQGSVAASPTAPTGIPAGAEPLYDFTVTAGATSTASLTAVRRHNWTVSNGGILPTGAGAGQFWDGTSWSPLASQSSGAVSFVSGFTGAAGNFPRWQRIGDRVFLQGAAQYTPGGGPAAPIPATGAFTITGPPPPRVPTRGSLISGGAKVHYVEVGTDLVFSFKGVSSSESGSFIWLDGYSYDVA